MVDEAQATWPFRFNDVQLLKIAGTLGTFFVALTIFLATYWDAGGVSFVVLVIGLGLLHLGAYLTFVEMKAPPPHWPPPPPPPPPPAVTDPALLAAEATTAVAVAVRALPEVVDRIAASLEKRRGSIAFVSLGIALVLLATIISGAVDVSVAFGSDRGAPMPSQTATERATNGDDG